MIRSFMMLVIVLSLFPGCNLREREKSLDQRSQSLDQREQELLLKERSLQLKEEELLKRELPADSVQLTDTTAVYDASLIGAWAVKMVCTEATCPGSAVGDTKNETWNLSYQNNTLLVRAMTGNQLVRVYSGIYNGSLIELSEDRDMTATAPASKMTVRLRVLNNNTLEGQREIIREGNCKILYSVNMTRP
jgi:superfamily I DNA and/or RNA helicase